MTDTTPSLDDLKEILWRALASPLGLVLATNSPRQAIRKLTQARFSAMDDALGVLGFYQLSEDSVCVTRKPEAKPPSQAKSNLTGTLT